VDLPVEDLSGFHEEIWMEKVAEAFARNWNGPLTWSAVHSCESAKGLSVLVIVEFESTKHF
jgi:hypothetical protein